MARYIDLKKAIEAIDNLPNCYNGYSDTYDKAYIIGTLEEVPTADVVERKRGKWEFMGLCDFPFRCSACITYAEHKTKYCPNCGAEMGDYNGEIH